MRSLKRIPNGFLIALEQAPDHLPARWRVLVGAEHCFLTKAQKGLLAARRAELRERDEKLSVLLADKSMLDGELNALRVEVAEAKKENSTKPDTHDYS